MPYRILTFDGGGSWVAMQAFVLGKLYGMDTSGHKILRQVDKVAASSTGSWILALLLCNYSPGQILRTFRDESVLKSFYPLLKDCEKSFFHIVLELFRLSPRYSGDRKRKALLNLLGADGDRFLKDFPAYVDNPSLSILFTLYDYHRNAILFCRSETGGLCARYSVAENEGEHSELDFQNITLIDAVHGATQMPWDYFNKPALICFYGQDKQYPRYVWDSSVAGIHNPILVAVSEALASGVYPEDIVITSLGAGCFQGLNLQCNEEAPVEVADYFSEVRMPGLFSDIGKIKNMMTGCPPEKDLYLALLLLNQNKVREACGLFRFNPVFQGVRDSHTLRPPKGWSGKKFKRLRRLRRDVRRGTEMELILEAVEDWMKPDSEIPNQVICRREDGRGVVAHLSFSSTLSGWRKKMEVYG